MRVAWMIVMAACRPGADGDATGRQGDDDADADTDADSDADADADADADVAPECDGLPVGPVPYAVYDIATTEDFDFDAHGLLVYQQYSELFGDDGTGGVEIIAGGIDSGTRGIQVLDNGDIAVALVTLGGVARVDRATGGSVPIATNISQANGLEAARDGLLYVSDVATMRVHSLDPATGDVTTLASGFSYPNGLAMTDDGDTLYVADTWDGTYRMSRVGGSWEAPELVRPVADSAGDGLDGIEVDACDNLYVIGFASGTLVRIDPVTLAETELLALDGAGWNSMRWGNDRGVWRRDVLYLTDRTRIVAVEVGVRGRWQPVDEVP